jgi:hypothetical protein
MVLDELDNYDKDEWSIMAVRGVAAIQPAIQMQEPKKVPPLIPQVIAKWIAEADKYVSLMHPGN